MAGCNVWSNLIYAVSLCGVLMLVPVLVPVHGWTAGTSAAVLPLWEVYNTHTHTAMSPFSRSRSPWLHWPPQPAVLQDGRQTLDPAELEGMGELP